MGFFHLYPKLKATLRTSLHWLAPTSLLWTNSPFFFKFYSNKCQLQSWYPTWQIGNPAFSVLEKQEHQGKSGQQAALQEEKEQRRVKTKTNFSLLLHMLTISFTWSFEGKKRPCKSSDTLHVELAMWLSEFIISQCVTLKASSLLLGFKNVFEPVL